jgi:hypothetical protein
MTFLLPVVVALACHAFWYGFIIREEAVADGTLH